jgi:hypothetical protein
MTKIIQIEKGATIKNDKMKKYKSGWQVCVNSKELVFLTVFKALGYAKKKGLKSYGLWFDNKKWYLDTNSIRVNTKKQAIELAKQNNQVAVWNWAKQKSVYV